MGCDIRPIPAFETLAWYGIRVRSQGEQMASTALRAKGYEEFLPVMRSRRRWSDRVKYIDKPLFPGYVFCRFEAKTRAAVLQTPAVVNIVSFGSEPLPIPEVEIQAVRTMLQSSLLVQPYPFLTAGRKIRLIHGPLAGTEGVILEFKEEFRLVASITLLQRSISVEIDPEWVTPVS